MKNSTVKNDKKIKTGKIPNSVGFNGKGGGVLITKTPEEYAKQFHTT
jgi:hypothetical protein